MLLRITARYAPLLVDNVRTFLGGSSPASQALIDYDTGQTVVASSKSFTVLRGELGLRSRELPALYAGVRAITSVPALAAIAVLGIVGVGLLGTVLLLLHVGLRPSPLVYDASRIDGMTVVLIGVSGLLATALGGIVWNR